MNNQSGVYRMVRACYYTTIIGIAAGTASYAVAPPGGSPAGCCKQVQCYDGTYTIDCIDPCASNQVCSGTTSAGSSSPGDPCWADAECIPKP